jgi:hypothetical protein
MKETLSPLFAATALLLYGGCTTQHEPDARHWEFQVATNMAEANQMVEKGWSVAGFTQYTDATGQPQTDYMLKKPKR